MEIISTKSIWAISIIGVAVVIGIMSPRLFLHRKDNSTPLTADRAPFNSIVIRDGSIVVTLHQRPSWLVSEGALEPRRTNPEESFTIPAGSTIRLFDRHSSYEVTAQITPEAGVRVHSMFDGRSFGDKLSKRSYFLPLSE